MVEYKFNVEHAHNNPKVIIIRGCMGSGKSTLAKHFQSILSEKFTICENDQYFADVLGDYSFWKPELVPVAMEYCLSKFKHNVGTKKVGAIVANVFGSTKSMRPYIEYCIDFNIPFTVIHALGEFNNVHNVPPNVVDNCRKTFNPFNISDFKKD